MKNPCAGGGEGYAQLRRMKAKTFGRAALALLPRASCRLPHAAGAASLLPHAACLMPPGGGRGRRGGAALNRAARGSCPRCPGRKAHPYEQEYYEVAAPDGLAQRRRLSRPGLPEQGSAFVAAALLSGLLSALKTAIFM